MVDLSWWILVICLCTFVYVVYFQLTKNVRFFADRGVPYIKPKLLFGSSIEFFLKRIELIEFIRNLYDAMPNERISGFFHLMSPVFFVRDPELFKRIAIKDFDSFEDHKFIIEPHMDAIMGNTLFLMRGEQWREMRAVLSPAFTGSKMRRMFELIRECALQSCDTLLNRPENTEQEIEFNDFFSRYTNDVIASCAFGCKLNSFTDRTNIFYQTGQKLQHLGSLGSFCKILLLRSMPWLTTCFGMEFLDAHMRRLFTELFMNNVRTRREKNISRPDLIDILMHAKRKPAPNGDARQWSEVEIVSQGFVFFLAGFDTVMWLLVSFAYELARNPDIQRRLSNEVDAANRSANGAEVTYETLKKMKYMEMVLNEVLRIHSPAVFIDRLCTKDFTLNDDRLQMKFVKGDHLWIPIYCFHHNPEYFPDPDTFDPDRFSDERKMNINPAHFVPFGQGQRQCIGNRFAQMEVKVLIYYLLKHFTLNVSAKTEIPMTVQSSPFGLAAAHGLHLTLHKRQ